MIRELLAEELASAGLGPRSGAAPKPQVREENVSIGSDAELAAFVRRLLEITKDGRARAEIEAGRHVFRLARGASAAPAYSAMPSATQNTPVSFERGLITEKEIIKLPDGVAVVKAGKRARFTPLAQDEMRRRGIKIERAKS